MTDDERQGRIDELLRVDGREIEGVRLFSAGSVDFLTMRH